jgi:hypothetical protein
MSKVSVYENAAEKAMAWTSRGNVEIQLTGSRFGLSYAEWDALIRATLKEDLYSTPRCLRSRKWDAQARLKQSYLPA